MKKIKRVFKILLLGLICCFSVMTLSSCMNEGKTAYEIAVENGYTGTESEWLQSLQGKDGVNGLDGADGKDSEITIKSLYDEAVLNGYDKSYLEFIEEYLSTEFSNDYIMNESLTKCVAITCSWTVSSFFGTTDSAASGSGVFYEINKEQGSAIVITNYHVVYNENSTNTDKISTNINCYLYGMENLSGCAMKATYIGGSITYDLALLKIENSDIIKNNPVKTVNISKNDIFEGASCYAVGNNQGKGIAISSGTISKVSEDASYQIGSTTVEINCTRVTCDINGGNSGGALFNRTGGLIGIVNCKQEETGIEGMCYAININIVNNLVTRILESYQNNEELYKCTLGVTIQAINQKLYFDEDTATYKVSADIVVYEFASTNVCDTVLKVNDKLLTATLNGETITLTDSFQLSEFLIKAHKNDTLTLSLQRDNTIMNVDIKLTQTTSI